MMGWAIAILFSAAVVLLILSYYKSGQNAAKIEQQIDQVTFSLMDEVHKLQQQIKNIEIDAEITAKEEGNTSCSYEKRLVLREIISLHRRGYSYESIAEKTERSKVEIERMLALYIKPREERSKVANDI